MSPKPILPPATLGVLGGGQLGRMFALAARRMGYEVAVYAPDADGPASQVASRTVCAPYDDLEKVADFAASVDAVSFEFENVPAATAEAAGAHAPLRPDEKLLHLAQHRLREKRALVAAGLPVGDFAAIEAEGDLAGAIETVGGDGVLKTAASGYDGKGQRRVRAESELAPAWRDLGEVPCIYERFVPFRAELSVIGARGVDGQVALYPASKNLHEKHILDVTIAPGPFSASILTNAAEITRGVLESQDVVGVLCVEMFLLEDDSLLVNEIAPRPHNSGHHTIDACACSQFEQQVRAMCALPLGDTSLVRPAAMANLLGDLWENGEPDWAAALAEPGLRLHLYGKRTARAGRKMGHLTALGSNPDDAEDRVRAGRARLLRGEA